MGPNDSQYIVDALKTYIASKQERGRKTGQIVVKLEELEKRVTWWPERTREKRGGPANRQHGRQTNAEKRAR